MLCVFTFNKRCIMALEVKKMKQGMSYSCKEKTIILNVFKYFRTEMPERCVTEIVRRTARATGCSEKSIFQFRKEEASAEGFKEPSKTKVRKYININSRDIKYDNNVRQAIRNIIYDLKYRNIVPSLNTILKQVNADTGLPKFSLMTLRRLLFDMGFYYEKNGSKFVLVEKTDFEQQPQNVKKMPQVTQPPAIVPQQNNLVINHVHPPPPPPPPMLNEQQHRLMYENEPMHSQHNMQMMLNVRRDLLPPHYPVQTNANIHPHWMHPIKGQ